ncbi:jerky protein homolog-like isoform X2 [Bombina bombina]|nr:jerky protein homolog-like isoform X2 [Bombina bombina]
MASVAPPQTFKKRRDSTLAEKVKILELLQQPKASQSSVARNMGLSQSTISRVMKKRDEILERWNQNENPSRKRNRPFKHAKVDEALLEWLLFAKANKLPISGPILMRRAEAIAKEIGCPQFKPSNGWLWRWKERYRLFYRGYSDRTEGLPTDKRNNGIIHTQNFKIHPDVTQMARREPNKSTVNEFLGHTRMTEERSRRREGTEMLIKSNFYNQVSQKDNWNRSLLLTQASKNYHPNDIFCAIGAPFQFRIIGDQSESPGHHKEAVFIWLCCNVNGSEKLKMMVAHSLSPKSLGMHSLSPVSLKTAENGYLTEDIFTEWLLNWDVKLTRQERKVLLAFTAHSFVPKVKLRSISLCIFSKDNMSSNQLFGQEVLNEFFTLYRELLFERLQEDCDFNKGNGLLDLKQLSTMTLVEASYTMNKAWLRVTTRTIKSCFQISDGEPVILCKNMMMNMTPNEEVMPFMVHRDVKNVLSSTPYSTSLGPYKKIYIKEKSDVEQEYGLEVTNSDPSDSIQEVTICSLASEEEPVIQSPVCLSIQTQSKVSKIYKMPKDTEHIPVVEVKSENLKELSHVQELRAACDVIQQFLSTEGQDMSTFFALQKQLDKCLYNQNKEQQHAYLLQK